MIKKVYEIEFYEKTNGKSEIWDFLEELRIKASKSKDARIQYKQILFYIELLSQNGLSLSDNIMKNLGDDLWELRPGNNRIFFFYYDREGRFVLLHYFRKKTQKTPKREIERARVEINDYLAREGEKRHENMERL